MPPQFPGRRPDRYYPVEMHERYERELAAFARNQERFGPAEGAPRWELHPFWSVPRGWYTPLGAERPERTDRDFHIFGTTVWPLTVPGARRPYHVVERRQRGDDQVSLIVTEPDDDVIVAAAGPTGVYVRSGHPRRAITLALIAKHVRTDVQLPSHYTPELLRDYHHAFRTVSMLAIEQGHPVHPLLEPTLARFRDGDLIKFIKDGDLVVIGAASAELDAYLKAIEIERGKVASLKTARKNLREAKQALERRDAEAGWTRLT